MKVRKEAELGIVLSMVKKSFSCLVREKLQIELRNVQANLKKVVHQKQVPLALKAKQNML